MILRSSLKKEVNMESQGNPGRQGSKQSLGQATTKSGKALEALRAAEAERRRKFREEQERLKREAASEKSAMRKIEREKRRERRRRYEVLLGGMVMEALERQGMSGTLLTAADLDILPAADRSELAAIIQHKADAPPDDTVPETHQRNAGGADFDLDG